MAEAEMNEVQKLQMCVMWLISNCASTGAKSMKVVQDGVTDKDKELGDWVVIVKKKTEHPQLEEGSKLLLMDLEILINDAEAGEFGDFTNEKYATPKVTLRKMLLELADNVEQGKYD